MAKNFEDAWNNNDASTLAGLFTEDAVLVNNTGPIYGREAIKKYYTDLFQNVHFSDNVTTYDPNSPHPIDTDGKEMCENGAWSMTWQVKGSDPVHGKGYHASVAVLEGSALKKRMLVTNVTPAPAVAQQTSTPDPQMRQRLADVIKKHADAMNNNDAAAAAACFTEDAVYVTDRGPIKGREAIEKMYADLFQKMHFSDHVITVDQDSPHIIGTDGKEMWATGGWSSTIQVQNSDPVQIKGFWAVIRGGDDLKIRMHSPYVTPADAKPSPTATPANQ